jgi:Ca2+-binding EF-hand superfamily protein
MKRCTMVLAGLLALSLWVDLVAAQPPDGPDRQRGERRRSSRGPEDQGFRGPPGPPGGPEGRGPGRGFIPPLMAALDADKDGEISAKEIDGAVKALKKLDKNEDGRLTNEELRPPMGGPGGFGPMGPGDRGRGRGPNEQGRGRRGSGEPGRMGGSGPGGPGGGNMAQRIMGFDENKDGRVTKDELPEPMQRMLERADANQDGAIDKEEAGKMAERMGRGGPGGQGGPGGRGGGDFVQRLMNLDRDDDGKVAKDELPEWMQERMFESGDANGDGFIDKKEAEKMAEQFQRGGGPPRGGGRGQGGPGGRPPGNARPQRPSEE